MATPPTEVGAPPQSDETLAGLGAHPSGTDRGHQHGAGALDDESVLPRQDANAVADLGLAYKHDRLGTGHEPDRHRPWLHAAGHAVGWAPADPSDARRAA